MVLNLTSSLAVILLHQAKNFLFLNIEAECAHSDFELMIVDSAGFVSIEKVECLLDLLLLLLRELLALTTLCHGLDTTSLALSQKLWLAQHASNLFEFELYNYLF